MFSKNVREAIKNGGWGPQGHGPRPTDDLTPPTKDSLFLYQLKLADPTALNEESLLVAKICETTQYSHSVFKTLRKEGVIDEAGHPDTTRIDRHLVNKIALISVPKQRELVNMLFWWEEEIMRWRLLEEESGDIQAAIRADSTGGLELGDRLMVIEAKKKIVPSLRRPDGSLKTAEDHPPEYVQ